MVWVSKPQGLDKIPLFFGVVSVKKFLLLATGIPLILLTSTPVKADQCKEFPSLSSSSRKTTYSQVCIGDTIKWISDGGQGQQHLAKVTGFQNGYPLGTNLGKISSHQVGGFLPWEKIKTEPCRYSSTKKIIPLYIYKADKISVVPNSCR